MSWSGGIDTSLYPAYAQRAMPTFDFQATDENAATNCGTTVLAAAGFYWRGVFLAPDYMKDTYFGQGSSGDVWSGEALQYLAQQFYGVPADVFYLGDAGTVQYYLRQFIRAGKIASVLVNEGTATRPVQHWWNVLALTGSDDDHTTTVTPHDPFLGRVYDNRNGFAPLSKDEFNAKLIREQFTQQYLMVGYHCRRAIDTSTDLWTPTANTGAGRATLGTTAVDVATSGHWYPQPGPKGINIPAGLSSAAASPPPPAGEKPAPGRENIIP